MALTVILLTPLPAKAHTHHHTIHHRVYRHHRHHHYSLVAATAPYADIVIDAESGRILHATDADSLRHPASLTKMMTLYLTFQALEDGRLKMDQELPVSRHASEQSPTKLGLRPGHHIRVQNCILGIVTQSANDAAVVLAEALGNGSESRFAAMMTREGHLLGMDHTHYNNASGLPNSGQMTTARDTAILAHALIYHFPQFYHYFSTRSFVYHGTTFENHDHLMARYPGMDGIKTGYVRASGFNLASSAVRDGTRLIGVVFGGHSSVSRDNRMALLLDQSFARDAQTESRLASETDSPNFPEGDSGDDAPAEHGEYVTLPAKLTLPEPPADAGDADGQWGVQIGAYDNPDLGYQALGRLVGTMPKLLGTAQQIVEKVSIGGTYMYRARLIGIDRQTAQTVCGYMANHGRSCLTVGAGPI